MSHANKVSVDPDLKPGRILRRYLDLPKYLDLLRSNAIYLRRADRFPDKFEGVLTPAIRKAMNKAHLNGHVNFDANGFSRELRKGIYVNCWSLGASDNMALWQLYGNVSASVAITTTIEKLIRIGFNWAASENVEIFKVRYIDHFRNPDMVIGNYSDPLRFKHSAYFFEREVRIIVNRIRQNRNQFPKPEGISLPVALHDLIRSVVVAPEADSWFFDLVSDITERYGVKSPVRRSKLTYLPK
jgi:hypothetical protein